MTITHANPRHAPGRVRRAQRDDIAAIARLMVRARARDGIPRLGEPEIDELMQAGEIVVLAVAQEVVAAVCLIGRGPHAHVAFLVCDPGVPGAEARIRAVLPGHPGLPDFGGRERLAS